MTAPSVAPTNLEIPREIVASWEREADASKPQERECGCASWRDYVKDDERFKRRNAKEQDAYVCALTVTCCTPCLAIPCNFDDDILLCWHQPWSPYGPIVCCCCWKDTYPAWLARQEPSAEQLQRHRNEYVHKKTVEYLSEQAAAPERVTELERSLDCARADLKRAVDSGYATASGDVAAVRKQLEHLRRELDSATITKERQLQSLRQQEEAAAKKGDYSAAERLQTERKRIESINSAAPLKDLIVPLEKGEALLAKVEGLATELAQARDTAGKVKREKARVARASAESDLHREMFKVADELGGIFSTLRDTNGDARFEAKDLVFGRPEQAALGVEHYMCVDAAFPTEDAPSEEGGGLFGGGGLGGMFGAFHTWTAEPDTPSFRLNDALDLKGLGDHLSVSDTWSRGLDESKDKFHESATKLFGGDVATKLSKLFPPEGGDAGEAGAPAQDPESRANPC